MPVMRKIVLCLLFMGVVVTLNATKKYNLKPSEDLSAFIDGLKNNTEDDIVVNLSQGIYYLNKPLRFNAEHRVPIKIIGKGKVIVSGDRSLNDWEVLPNGFWRTKIAIDDRIYQLNIDGCIMQRAKSPNNGVYYLQDGDLIVRDGSNVTYKAVMPEGLEDELKSIQEHEKPVINLFRLFTHSKSYIQSYNIEDRSLTYTELYTYSFFKPSNNTGFILENYFAALDSPGEWYQDKDGYVYYMPREGESVNDLKISYPKLYNLVTILGSSSSVAGNVTFQNIIFEGCGVKENETGIAPYQSAYTLDGAVRSKYANNVNIVNCEFRGIGGYAVWIMEKCEGCQISGNYIHDIAGGGIKIGGLNIKEKYACRDINASNNIIRRIGRDYPGVAGVILTYAHHCDISHNDISDGYYTGISVGFSWGYGESPTHDNKISYNRISNLGQGMLNDFAGIYTLGISPGTIINNNLIYDIKPRGGGAMGIYTDEGSSDILIENNVAYNCKGGGFHQHYGSNNIVRNNIFAYGEKYNLEISAVKKPEDVQLILENNVFLISKGDAISGRVVNSGKFIFKDNCFYAVNGQALTVNGESFENWMDRRGFTYTNNDPRLRNPEKGDFRFKSKRLARKMGFKPIDVTKAGANWHPSN